jgi:hypothetical protein
LTYLAPFFLLLGRPAVFWIGLATLAASSLLVTGLSQPDELWVSYVNGALLAAFGFPAAAGWLAGFVVQEFQHSSFAWSLPGVRRRLAAGYLTTGLALSAVVTFFTSQAASAQNHFMVLGALAMAGYCAGGVLLDPFRRSLTALNAVLVVGFVYTSKSLADAANRYPLGALLVAITLGALAASRLFSRETFRKKPFTPMSPLPGSYYLKRSADYERAQQAGNTTRGSNWRQGYLGAHPWRWARAAALEGYGALTWRSALGRIRGFWILGLLFGLHAWRDKGALGFWESLGRTIYETVLHSPHAPRFGEIGADPLVPMLIGAVGATLALWSPAGLKTSLLYPLSRSDRARVTFRAGLVDATTLFLAVGGGLLLLGQTAGWLTGHSVRLDFMPFFLRGLLGTVALMPLALGASLRIRTSGGRSSSDALVWMVLGLIGFVVAVVTWSYHFPDFGSPAIEITTSLALVATGQLAYRRWLRRFFAGGDLV